MRQRPSLPNARAASKKRGRVADSNHHSPPKKKRRKKRKGRGKEKGAKQGMGDENQVRPKRGRKRSRRSKKSKRARKRAKHDVDVGDLHFDILQSDAAQTTESGSDSDSDLGSSPSDGVASDSALMDVPDNMDNRLPSSPDDRAASTYSGARRSGPSVAIMARYSSIPSDWPTMLNIHRRRSEHESDAHTFASYKKPVFMSVDSQWRQFNAKEQPLRVMYGNGRMSGAIWSDYMLQRMHSVCSFIFSNFISMPFYIHFIFVRVFLFVARRPPQLGPSSSSFSVLCAVACDVRAEEGHGIVSCGSRVRGHRRFRRVGSSSWRQFWQGRSVRHHGAPHVLHRMLSPFYLHFISILKTIHLCAASIHTLLGPGQFQASVRAGRVCEESQVSHQIAHPARVILPCDRGALR